MAVTSVMSRVISPFKPRPPHVPGCSPLERLPTELLSKIISSLAEPQIETPYNMLDNLLVNTHLNSRPTNIVACLLTSHHLHDIALPVMYRDPNVKRFQKFSRVLESKPELGCLIRSLDISRFRATIPLTVIRTCLSLMPSLRNCCLMLEDLGEEGVLERVLNGMQSLESLKIETCYPIARDEWRIPHLIHDFIKRSSTSVGASITSLTCNLRDVPCSKMFEVMLPNMSNLRVLDVAQTDITCRALGRIASTARLTHLDVTYCRNLPGTEFADFLAKHSATKDSLVTLLASNVSCGGQLLTESEVTIILANAPPTLRSLNLGYSEMNQTHLPYLRKLCVQLEELGVGRNLSFRDIEDVLMSQRYVFNNADNQDVDAWEWLEDEPRYESILQPMRDAAVICKLRQRIHSVSLNPCRRSTVEKSTIRYLNISSIPPQQQGKIKESVLWAEESMPLEAIEMSSAMFSRLCGAVGWRYNWSNGRVWVERI